MLAGLGLVILLDNLGGGDDDIPFGLVLVGLGGIYLWSRRKSEGGRGGPPASPVTPAPPAPPATAAPTDTLADASPAADTVAFAGPEVSGPPAQPTPHTAPKSRSVIVPVTLSLLAILAGGLSLIGVSVTTGLVLALLLTAAALVFGAWRGRARGLIPIGIVLAMGLAATSAVGDVPLRGGTGQVSFHPAALEEIRTPYRLSAGELVVDLSDVDLRGQTVTIVASVAAGNLQLVVPGDVAVDVDAHVGAGDINAFGRLVEGFDIDRSFTDPGREGAGRLVVRAQVGLGQMEVRRALS